MDSPKEEMNLYFRITKTISMKAKRSDTIKNLKVGLREKTGISENVQELFFAGDHLRDGHRLLDYDIPRNSTVHLIHVESFPMNLCIRMPSKEKIIKLQVLKRDTIQKIKSMIQDKEGICPYDFEIYSSGRLLENHRTVASLNLQREGTLQMIFNPKDTGSIYVQTPTRGLIKVEFRWMHTVLDVKKIIQSMINVPSQCMNLFIAGTEEQLEDQKTLACYDIDEDKILTIQTPDVFQISVKSLTGRNSPLDVFPSSTVFNVKELLSDVIGIQTYHQRITFNGREIDDSRTLDSYGIGKESILHMLLRQGRLPDS